MSKPKKDEVIQGGEVIQGESFQDLLGKMQGMAGGRPVRIVSNPVNPDGSLTPEAQAIVDAQKKS